MFKLKNATHKSDPQTVKLAIEALAKLRLRTDLGFMQLPNQLEKIQSRATEIKKIFKQIVILGIGGSALGTRALIDALGILDSKISILILDNVDSFSFFKSLEAADLKNCHFLIISKSGQTIETLTQAELVEQLLLKRSLPGLAQVSTVISELDTNPLNEWAKKFNVPILEIPKDVGGRFSVLTPVGLLPAALAGHDLNKFQLGANWAKQQDQIIVELVAQSLMSFNRGEWVSLFWCYCDRLQSFGYWLQQLWAESLAKTKDRAGNIAPRASTPMPCVGSTDQHSILQQIMDGYRDKFIFFFRVLESEKSEIQIEKNLFRGQELMKNKSMGELFSAQADAVRESLAAARVNSLSCQLEKIDESSLAALFMLFQLIIGTLGEALNINAYDQPGVEAGKVAAKIYLTNQTNSQIKK